MHVSRVTVPVTVSLASTDATPPAARSIWPAWLLGVLASAAERRQLLAMEQRELRDIGLTPSEARLLAQKPLWRVSWIAAHDEPRRRSMSLVFATHPPIRPSDAIEAELNYLGPVEGRPFTYTFTPPAGRPRSNITAEPHCMTIRDLRPIAASVSLDRKGFAVAYGASALHAFDDEATIHAVYYPERTCILQEATGATRVHIFDHTIRRQLLRAEDRGAATRQPVARVHVDHTEHSGPQRVRDLLPDEAEALLRGRVQIVSLWRPIAGPVQDMPLAVCDTMSTAPGDLVASDLIYPDRRGETYQVRFNPAHRWYWLPEMTTDEALLLKVYDSARDGVARFSPHTAFADPGAPANAPPRQSIEIRALLFHAT